MISEILGNAFIGDIRNTVRGHVVPTVSHSSIHLAEQIPLTGIKVVQAQCAPKIRVQRSPGLAATLRQVVRHHQSGTGLVRISPPRQAV
uniref:Uncharacterized protein n=1 Tax=Pseudomonas phage vB_PaeP_FBPa42 TaxID=3231240 RepID=A0AAU8KVB8_9VIRU